MNADRRTAPFDARLELGEGAAGAYPTVRLRRNRRDAWTRTLVAENVLTVGDLIWPIFVIEGTNETRPVATMPGQVRVTIDRRASRAVDRNHLAHCLRSRRRPS